MRTALAFVLAALTLAPAQTNSGPPSGNSTPSPAPPDPAKVAELQKRFQDGYAQEQAGQLVPARAVFDAILAEQPEARRSLLEAGRVSLALHEPQKAEGYLSRLNALSPQLPAALELLIQAEEALHQEAKAERLVEDFRALRDSSSVPAFHGSVMFVRDRIPFDAGAEVVISQFFDFTQPPHRVLQAESFDAQHVKQRVLFMQYDPEGTTLLRAKDKKLAHDEIFTLLEPVYTGGKIAQVKVYRELMSTPEYAQARAMLLQIFSSAPSPIYTQSVAPSP